MKAESTKVAENVTIAEEDGSVFGAWRYDVYEVIIPWGALDLRYDTDHAIALPSVAVSTSVDDDTICLSLDLNYGFVLEPSTLLDLESFFLLLEEELGKEHAEYRLLDYNKDNFTVLVWYNVKPHSPGD